MQRRTYASGIQGCSAGQGPGLHRRPGARGRGPSTKQFAAVRMLAGALTAFTSAASYLTPSAVGSAQLTRLTFGVLPRLPQPRDGWQREPAPPCRGQRHRGGAAAAWAPGCATRSPGSGRSLDGPLYGIRCRRLDPAGLASRWPSSTGETVRVFPPRGQEHFDRRAGRRAGLCPPDGWWPACASAAARASWPRSTGRGRSRSAAPGCSSAGEGLRSTDAPSRGGCSRSWTRFPVALRLARRSPGPAVEPGRGRPGPEARDDEGGDAGAVAGGDATRGRLVGLRDRALLSDHARRDRAHRDLGIEPGASRDACPTVRFAAVRIVVIEGRRASPVRRRSLVGGQAVPPSCFQAVPRDPATELVHQAQVVPRLGASLFSSATVPPDCLFVVLTHTKTDVVHVAEVRLPESVPLLRGPQEPSDRLFVVLYYPATVAVPDADTQRKNSHRRRPTLRGSSSELDARAGVPAPRWPRGRLPGHGPERSLDRRRAGRHGQDDREGHPLASREAGLPGRLVVDEGGLASDDPLTTLPIRGLERRTGPTAHGSSAGRAPTMRKAIRLSRLPLLPDSGGGADAASGIAEGSTRRRMHRCSHCPHELGLGEGQARELQD